MTTPPSLPPANWYPDPQTPGQLRYWDGQRWTQHTHVQQQAPQGASAFGVQGVQGAAGVGQTGAPGAGMQGMGMQGAGMQGGGAPGAGQQMAGQQMAGQQMAGQQMAGQQMAGQQMAGQQMAGQQMAGQQAGGYQPGGFQQGAALAGGYQQQAQAAGPATGALFAPGVAGAAQGAQAAGPATGGMFIPGGAGGAPGQGFGFGPTGAGVGAGGPTIGAVINTPSPRQPTKDDDGSENKPASEALISLVFGVAAIAATLLAVYKVGTPVDDYLAYAGAGLGFMAVLFGLLGRKKAADGLARGSVSAWVGIAGGFLGMALSFYEILYPGDLADMLRDVLG